jgi:hypothetical protein
MLDHTDASPQSGSRGGGGFGAFRAVHLPLCKRHAFFAAVFRSASRRLPTTDTCPAANHDAGIGPHAFVPAQGVYLVAPENPQTEDTRRTVINIDSFRDRTKTASSPETAMRAKVEVACNEPVGEEIKQGLERELGKLGGMTIVPERPDWVFSIIAFHQGQLVELSIILRRLFRGTKPGTEIDTNLPESERKVRPGAWVYESLRFHGLFGVRLSELSDLFVSVADEFRTNHLAGEGRKRPAPLLDKQDDR